LGMVEGRLTARLLSVSTKTQYLLRLQDLEANDSCRGGWEGSLLAPSLGNI
jgi:hypothetical protein